MQNKGDKRIKKASQKKELKSRGMVTIPYVKGLSEAFSRILKTQDLHGSKTIYYIEKSAGAPQRQNQWRRKARGGL